MRNNVAAIAFALLACLALCSGPAPACTSILVTKGASADGSVIITYAADAEFHPHLYFSPAADYKFGEVFEIRGRAGQVRGTVSQVAHTYAVVGLMNEHQVAIGETTYGGREELHDPDGLLNYGHLMILALQRVRTAREAIGVITALAGEYGYSSSGESFSIADTQEAWILDFIGKGPGRTGIVWVARRVPDGFVSVHANMSRIGSFPLDEPESCLYSEDVISFAVKMGYYDPDSGEPFSFRDAYDPASPGGLRACATRVWRVLQLCAPSLDLSTDYHRGVPGAEPYPLWVEPDEPLSVSDVMDLMRDHYEGTEYDMTHGVDAGPFGSILRCRPLSWKLDRGRYMWERPIATQQSGFVFVSQSRSWLPDAVGGVFWYCVDDAYTSCFVPLYCGISEVPRSFTVGTLRRFSWDSAWWVFNFVTNLAYARYSDISADIIAVQRDIEGTFFALQGAVERTAVELGGEDEVLMRRYLTDYSVGHGEQVVRRWIELGEFLLTKYNDGFVQDEDGRPQQPGYPSEWLRRVLEEKGEQLALPNWGEESH